MAQLNRLGGQAIGLCGMDGQLFQAEQLDEKYGLVGKITGVNPEPVENALLSGYIPVVSTVAQGVDADTAYNINADTAASKLAAAMGAEKLILLTDVRGLLRNPRDEETLIHVVHTYDVPGLVAQGIISGGMIPKMECCVDAIAGGVERVHILDGRIPHSILIELLSDEGIGTMLKRRTDPMTSQEIKALTGQYIMNTYGRFPVAIDHGQGATLYDPEGNAYIDFTSGIGVSDLGYGCQPWVDAIAKQAGKIGHTSNLFYTEPPARLAEILCKRTGMSSVFFANGGGEANEGMIKLARKYSFDKYGRGRAAIVTLNNSFHGRTITTLTATGQDVFHNYFFPFTEGFRYADANDLASLEAAAGTTCAVMMELVQGEGRRAAPGP